MKTIFENSGGTYTQVGNYLLPNLSLSAEEKETNIGVWAMRHKRYLKQNHIDGKERCCSRQHSDYQERRCLRRLYLSAWKSGPVRSACTDKAQGKQDTDKQRRQRSPARRYIELGSGGEP